MNDIGTQSQVHQPQAAGEKGQSGILCPAELERHVRLHMEVLGHKGCGVTELRVFEPRPLVAYSENVDSVVRLCREMDGQVTGIYVGVQPRPLWLYDMAPGCWRLARSGQDCNCARDRDIEFVTALFYDIDVVSPERSRGHPASKAELAASFRAAKLLCREDGLALSSVICCTGNGHYVLAPLEPIPVYSEEAGEQFRRFCCDLAERVASQVDSVRLDPVYNLSRVMRVMGTVNRKGQAVEGRLHRRARFVSDVLPARSAALHHMILNTRVARRAEAGLRLSGGIKCDLRKIESCRFIQYCRGTPQKVSEPQWFAMITNLAWLEGGPELAHEISRLDSERYDYMRTQRLIERVLSRGYRPVGCEGIGELGFRCPRIGSCPAGSPMYGTGLRCVYG